MDGGTTIFEAFRDGLGGGGGGSRGWLFLTTGQEFRPVSAMLVDQILGSDRLQEDSVLHLEVVAGPEEKDLKSLIILGFLTYYL